MIKNFGLVFICITNLYASSAVFYEGDGFTTSLSELRTLISSHPHEMLNEKFFSRAVWLFTRATDCRSEKSGHDLHQPTALERLEILHAHHKTNNNISHKFLHKELGSCRVNKDVISWFLANGYDPNYIWRRKVVSVSALSLIPPSLEPNGVIEVGTTVLDELILKLVVNDSLGREVPSNADVKAVELLKEHGARFGNKSAAINAIDSILSGKHIKRAIEFDNTKKIKDIIADICELPKP